MSLTKQEMQSCMDNARMRLMDSMPSRQDVQTLKDTTRNLVTLLNQSQQYMNQSQRQRNDLIRRTISLESRLAQLEQGLHEVHRIMNTVASQRPQERVTERIVVANSEEQERAQPYGYTPVNYASHASQ